MLATSAGYQQMIAGHTVTSTPVRIQVTLPTGVNDVSTTLTQAKITASTTTDQPDGVRFEVGYPAMQLTFTVADAAGLFAPYNSASPLYRQNALNAAVTADWGTPTGTGGAVEWLRKFTGQVDSYVSNTDGTVTFTCVDNRTKLRSASMLPTVVTAPPFNAGITSEFAIDYLLRGATNGAISSWPAQRPNCALAVGFRSSLWAEVGAFASSALLPSFTAGAFGSAYNVSGTANPTWTLARNIGTTAFMECWLHGLSGSSGVHLSVQSSTQSFTFDVNAGGVVVEGGGGQWTGLALDSGPHYFAAQFSLPPVGSASTVTCTLWIDNASHSLSFAPGFTRDSNPWNTATAATYGASSAQASIEGWQITTEASPTPNNTFAPGAILGSSFNPVQVVPSVDAGADPWQIIQQIADAEQAVAGFDESGVFRFQNRDMLRTGTSVRAVTSSVALKDLDVELQAGAVYNRVQIPFQGWTFGAATTAYAFASKWKVAAHSTGTLTVNTDGLVAQIDGVVANLPNTHYPLSGGDLGQSWYRASVDRAGTSEHPGVTVTAAQTDPTTVVITVVNNTSRDAWFVSPSNYSDLAVGTPSLWIGGQPVTQGDTLTADTGPSGGIDVTYQAGSNPWLQDQDAANALAMHLLDEMSGINPLLTNVSIVPDPSLQLGDRIQLIDPDVTGINEYATLWGWDLTMAAGGDDMTIDARAIASPGQWILDVDGRSELDQTTYI